MSPRPAPRATGARATRHLLTAVVVAVLVATASACSSSSHGSATPSTTTTAPASTTTTSPDAQALVFAPVGGNIDVYLSEAPYTRQRVVVAGTGPEGTAPHGQVCFLPDGTRRFVVAETSTPAGGPATAGWGLYQLTGTDVGQLRVRRVGGWTSPGAPSADAPTTYGCAFLPDGRLLTTDVGNRTSGDPTGQLVEWFGPFDGTATPSSCVIAGALASPHGLASDPDGSVYLASDRAPTSGLWRYRGTFPADASSCVQAIPEPADEPPPTSAPSTSTTLAPPGRGGTTSTTTPPPPRVTAKMIVAGGSDGLNAPTAVAVALSGKALVVTSPPDGRMVAYDLDGTSPTTVLQPPKTTATTGAAPPTGNPYGVTVTPGGAIVYTDLGLERAADGSVAPGDRAGSIRRIDTSGGTLSPPETMDGGLDAPDGLGLYLGGGGGSGAASKV